MTDWDHVRRLTLVPFLHDGRCALIPVDDRLVLPSGAEASDALLTRESTGLRVA
jgi:hypothetical protein